jgi:putative SbcD/Mre11-related phosphoesterase
LSERVVELRPGELAHASGALWLPDLSTALLADVHLGFGWALRRRGQLGPVDDDAVQTKLGSVVEELNPRHIVFLGDVVHAPRPAPKERLAIESTLGQLATRSELTVVLGNHDRGFIRDYPELPVSVRDFWKCHGFLAVHGDKPVPAGVTRLVVGHIHPAIGVVDHAGASRKVPVFVVSDSVVILPAFSPSAAGFNVRGAALPPHLRGRGEVRVIAASGRRAVDLGSLARLRGV